MITEAPHERNRTLIQPQRAVPVVDIEPFLRDDGSDAARAVVDGVRAACETVGFLEITGHGITPVKIETMCQATREFFDLPAAEKARYDFDEFGFRPSESGSLAKTTGQNAPGDLCETFRFSPRALTAAGERGIRREALNIFPSSIGQLGDAWLDWFRSMELLASQVMTIFASALGLHSGWFTPYFEHDSSSLIANYYGNQTTAPRDGQLRRGAHTDFGVLTILYQNTDDGGLEVRHPGTGSWLHVPFVPNTFVLNIGDLMERWTNGRWLSTMHRVVNPLHSGSGEPRISIPFFYRPDPDSIISAIDSCHGPGDPPRFIPVKAGEWMESKQRLIYPD